MKNTSFTDKETRVRSLAAVPSIQCDPKASSTGIQWIQRLHSRLSCSLVCAIISLMHLLLLFSFSHTYSTLCSSHTPTQIPNSIPFSVEPLFPHHSCSQVPWQVSLWQCLGIFLGRAPHRPKETGHGVEESNQRQNQQGEGALLKSLHVPPFIPPKATSLLWSLLLHKPTHHYSCLHTITSNNNNS